MHSDDGNIRLDEFLLLRSAAIHLTDVLAAKLISSFVTVNAILPGVFPSKMTEWGFRKNQDKLVASQPTGSFSLNFFRIWCSFLT